MLRNICENCLGNIGGCEKENCDNGYIKYDDDKMVYVTAYAVTREYGGSEEGGWWYSNYTALETVPCRNKHSDDIVKALENNYADTEHGDVSSVLGGSELHVMIEEKPCENETKSRPYYE